MRRAFLFSGACLLGLKRSKYSMLNRSECHALVVASFVRPIREPFRNRSRSGDKKQWQCRQSPGEQDYVGADYERPLLYRIETPQKVVEASKPPLKLDFLAPIAGAIEKAPSDKAIWAENLPPARLGRKPTKDAPASEKAIPATKRVVRRRLRTTVKA